MKKTDSNILYFVSHSFEKITENNNSKVEANASQICFYNESSTVPFTLNFGTGSMIIEAGMESPTFGINRAGYFCDMVFDITPVAGLNVQVIRTFIKEK